MQFHFGHKITLVFIGFATLMGVLVYKSIHTQFYLVSKEYYKDELAYQQIINASENAVNAKKSIQAIVNNKQLHITFLPSNTNKETVSGNIIIYNPANDKSDLQVPIYLSATNEQLINVAPLPHGNYIVKAVYSINNVSYYNTVNVKL